MRFRVGDKVEVTHVTWSAFYNTGARGFVVSIDEDSCEVEFTEGEYDKFDGRWYVSQANLKLIERVNNEWLNGKVVLLNNGGLYLVMGDKLIGLHSNMTLSLRDYRGYKYYGAYGHNQNLDLDSVYDIKNGYSLANLCSNFGEVLELIMTIEEGGE